VIFGCIIKLAGLKYAGIASLVEALLWALDLIYEAIFVQGPDPLFILVLIFLFILFVGVAIALYILAELIRQGTEYKVENELTI